MAAVAAADPNRPTPPIAAPAADPRRDPARRHWRANLCLTALLLAAWFAVGFVIPWFARDLDFAFFGWPFSFWVAAQGGTCVFVVLIAAYAFGMRRLDRAFEARRPDSEVHEAPGGASAGRRAQ